MKILVIAEHDNQRLKLATHHTLTAAQKVAQEIVVMVVGANCAQVSEEAAQLNGVTKVLIADHECYAHQLAENTASLIAEQAQGFNYIVAPATTFGKNLLPRVAALLDVSMLSDVMEVVAADTFVRPIYAGNALATVKTNDAVKLFTVRTTAFAATGKGSAKASIEAINTVIENTQTRFIGETLTQSTRPELTNARVVISGGRGLKSAENFKLLDDIADQLNAAIGASRAAVDAGFAPNDYQVGQTGKVVAPDLYIAVGISGAIQHLAGMKDSKVIVAINNDPEAPIFELADYGLVGDLFQILPELKEEISKAEIHS